MTKQAYHFEYEVYAGIEALQPADAALLTQARAVTANAYAPYSHFLVGAVAALLTGETVSGTNQENGSYPVGLCAERVLLSTASTLFPGVAISTMAISYHNLNGTSDHPISPCGMCRQYIAEYQDRMNHPIRLILGGLTGEVYIIDNAKRLLPLGFDGSILR
jgi:cytidine deaminase